MFNNKLDVDNKQKYMILYIKMKMKMKILQIYVLEYRKNIINNILQTMIILLLNQKNINKYNILINIYINNIKMKKTINIYKAIIYKLLNIQKQKMMM